MNLETICSDWKWCLQDQKTVAMISSIGDLFVVGKDESINWLDTGYGVLTRIADNIQQFKLLLKDENNIENWFLASLVEQFISNGILLNENEVYGFKTFPALGGDYSLDNFEPTNIYIHFAFAGQIHEQIKDLPEGTKINKVTFKKK